MATFRPIFFSAKNTDKPTKDDIRDQNARWIDFCGADMCQTIEDLGRRDDEVGREIAFMKRKLNKPWKEICG